MNILSWEQFNESIKLPIKVGDEVMMGRFKNKKTIIKKIEWNDKGDLLVNGKSALKLRIPKKAKKSKKKS
jgi:hypothetical protein